MLRRSFGFIALLVLALAGYLLSRNEARQVPAAPPPPAQSQPQTAPAAPPAAPAGGTKIHLPGPGDPGTVSPDSDDTAGSVPTPTKPQQQSQPKPPIKPLPTGKGYILALSWSPSFCANEDPSGRSDQCRIGVGKGLVVHGLWPDGSDGRDEYCTTDEPRRLPDDIARRVKGYMPSVGLARHEWEKHGACTGLGQRGYFETMERAWRQFRVPALLLDLQYRQSVSAADLADAIRSSNPDLDGRALSFSCGRAGVLNEIRLCLTTDLKARDCGRPVRRDCSGSITLLPPR